MNYLPLTPEHLDLLVDGELSETERRQLLDSLDREPDGWRRCALAFLEAQCWKKEFGGLKQSTESGLSAVAPVCRSLKRKSSPLGLPGTLMAMAASFLLFLGAGILWQHLGNRTGGIFGAAGQNQIADKIGGPSITIASAPQNAVVQGPAQAENASAPWQWVKMAPVGSTNPDETVQLPAQERDRIDEHWLQNMPSLIPENVVQALKRSGYKIQTQRELLPMPLKDGRRLVVPVDQVELNYVGDQTY
jgi:hypothetical protein